VCIGGKRHNGRQVYTGGKTKHIKTRDKIKILEHRAVGVTSVGPTFEASIYHDVAKMETLRPYLQRTGPPCLKSLQSTQAELIVKGEEDLKFDKHKIIQRIMSDTGESPEGAKLMVQQLNQLHPDLYSDAKAWVNRIENTNKKPVEIQGITIDTLMNKHSSSRIEAILLMDGLLKNPQLVQKFKNLRFERK